MASYYYWSSYDIKDQNSSTNVTKSVRYPSGINSPAKVFTANNTPSFVNYLEQLPSPTEAFVRNYGPRLHHMAGIPPCWKISSTWWTGSSARATVPCSL